MSTAVRLDYVSMQIRAPYYVLHKRKTYYFTAQMQKRQEQLSRLFRKIITIVNLRVGLQRGYGFATYRVWNSN